jgi:hypothetical protein
MKGLELKLKPKFAAMKKIKKLTPNCFDLYLDGYIARGSTISAKELYVWISEGCKNGKEIKDQAIAVCTEVLKEDDVTFTLPDASRIVEQFTVERKEKGAFTVNEETFYIGDKYLPDDDKAPERIYNIVNDYCTGINTYFNDQIATNDAMPKVTTSYRGRWTVEQDNSNLLYVHPEGELIPVEEQKQLKKDHVITTMFAYQCDLPKEKTKQIQELSLRTITINKGNLKGLEIGLKKDRIVPFNIDKFNEETQITISEVINYFQV